MLKKKINNSFENANLFLTFTTDTDYNIEEKNEWIKKSFEVQKPPASIKELFNVPKLLIEKKTNKKAKKDYGEYSLQRRSFPIKDVIIHYFKK